MIDEGQWALRSILNDRKGLATKPFFLILSSRSKQEGMIDGNGTPLWMVSVILAYKDESVATINDLQDIALRRRDGERERVGGREGE